MSSMRDLEVALAAATSGPLDKIHSTAAVAGHHKQNDGPAADIEAPAVSSGHAHATGWHLSACTSIS